MEQKQHHYTGLTDAEVLASVTDQVFALDALDSATFKKFLH